MKSLIDAALGAAARRLLLIDAPPALLGLAGRPSTTLVVVTAARRRRLRAWHAALEARRERGGVAQRRSPPVALVAARAEALPFSRPGFDAVVAAAGVTPRATVQPVDALRSLRSLLRPGGALLVASRLREGDVGTAASLAGRIVKRQVLPTAGELATWMLVAGLRSVRQARLPRRIIPTALTWATARPRPWADEPAETPEQLEAPADAAEPDAVTAPSDPSEQIDTTET